MALVLPWTINPGDDILAEKLQANFQAIADKFSGGLVNADFSTLCALDGAKLAANSLPGDRIASGTITQTQMGSSSIGSAQLIALGVTKDKLAVAAGSRATKSQLEINVLTGTVGFTIGGANKGFAFWAEIATQLVGGVSSWIVKVHQPSSASGLVQDVNSSVYTASLVPSPSAIPSASTTPLGVVLRNPVFTAGGGQVDVDFYYIANS